MPISVPLSLTAPRITPAPPGYAKREKHQRPRGNGPCHPTDTRLEKQVVKEGTTANPQVPDYKATHFFGRSFYIRCREIGSRWNVAAAPSTAFQDHHLPGWESPSLWCLRLWGKHSTQKTIQSTLLDWFYFVERLARMMESLKHRFLPNTNPVHCTETVNRGRLRDPSPTVYSPTSVGCSARPRTNRSIWPCFYCRGLSAAGPSRTSCSRGKSGERSSFESCASPKRCVSSGGN